jgi:hypothetical protein
LRCLGRYPLPVVDIPIEPEATNQFFQLVAVRYERASLIVTSNQPFVRWGEVFSNEVVAAAMTDRLVHHAEVLALEATASGSKTATSAAPHHPRPPTNPPKGSAGEVCLAGAGRSEQQHVVLGCDEVQGPEVGNLLALETAGVVEVEFPQALAGRKPGGPHSAFAAMAVAGRDLALPAGGEILLMGPGLGPGPLGEPTGASRSVGAFNAGSEARVLGNDHSRRTRGPALRSTPVRAGGRVWVNLFPTEPSALHSTVSCTCASVRNTGAGPMGEARCLGFRTANYVCDGPLPKPSGRDAKTTAA